MVDQMGRENELKRASNINLTKSFFRICILYDCVLVLFIYLFLINVLTCHYDINYKMWITMTTLVKSFFVVAGKCMPTKRCILEARQMLTQ